MIITISSQDYWDLWNTVNETPQHSDPSDLLDMTWKQPRELGEGYVRDIQLRDGLELTSARNQFHNEIISPSCDRAHWLEYCFHLTGGALSGALVST